MFIHPRFFTLYIPLLPFFMSVMLLVIAAIHKVHTVEIPRVPQCLSPQLGPPPPPSPLPQPSVPSTRSQRGEGTLSPACEGVGESQFGRLERKLSTLFFFVLLLFQFYELLCACAAGW
jgi:hypothetical protein